MNKEYKETVKQILQSNRSSFEHLANQCQSHIERVDNALKKLEEIQEQEATSEELQLEALKQSVLTMWRRNRSLMDYFETSEEPLDGVAADFYNAFDQYASMLVCPYCKKQNVEEFNDDELEPGVNRWRLQCQHCGLATPQLVDAEEVINIWDKFCKLF